MNLFKSKGVNLLSHYDDFFLVPIEIYRNFAIQGVLINSLSSSKLFCHLQITFINSLYPNQLFSYFATKTYVVGIQKSCINNLSTQNNC